jgi:hypothetical protein
MVKPSVREQQQTPVHRSFADGHSKPRAFKLDAVHNGSRDRMKWEPLMG